MKISRSELEEISNKLDDVIPRLQPLFEQTLERISKSK